MHERIADRPNASHELRLSQFEYGIVQRKIRQMIGRHGFTRQDWDDLEQELLTRLWQGLRSFDPSVAHRNAFVTAIVERSVATILRDASAEKRDRRRITSLQERTSATEEGSAELSESISRREYNNRRCRDPRDDEDLALLTSDVSTAIASLPEDLRDLAERLKTQSISAIARDLGIPRTTLNDAVRRLRRCFDDMALRNYL